MKYIYFIQIQKWKSHYKPQQSQLKIKFSNSDYLIYLGKDEKDNEIFVFYFKRTHNYLIKIFKNILQEILNEKDILFFIHNEEGNELI
jgi:hypothetical protein